jgi:cytochrome c biogenesis protein CcdA
MPVHETLFISGLYLSYLLYIVAFFQIGTYNPKYLDLLEQYMKYYVTGFLLLRFNPFTKTQFTEFDRRVVFSSAVFLLTTTAIVQYAKTIDIHTLLNVVRKYFS